MRSVATHAAPARESRVCLRVVDRLVALPLSWHARCPTTPTTGSPADASAVPVENTTATPRRGSSCVAASLSSSTSAARAPAALGFEFGASGARAARACSAGRGFPTAATRWVAPFLSFWHALAMPLRSAPPGPNSVPTANHSLHGTCVSLRLPPARELKR